MTLNPQIEALLAMIAQMPSVDFAAVTPAEMRAVNESVPIGAPLAMPQVRDLSLALPGRTIAARLYVPEGIEETPPLVLFYHGGGWVTCSVETHDGLARALACSSAAAVLSVGYRLAPETPFPGPLDDCYEALRWAADHAAELGVDSGRLAVAGDSAGGNLAAAVAIRARDEGGPQLAHQLLIYPVTDADFARDSHAHNGDGAYLLSTEAMRWYWAHYVGDIAAPPSLAAVLRHEDLAALPPATIVVAEYDPLRDEGLAYARALEAAGVAVRSEVAPGMIHGFFSLTDAVPDAQPFLERAGAALRSAFASL